MKKAIKFCLALAMAGALAVPAYAEVTLTSTGHAEGNFKQESSKDATADAKNISTQDFSADGEIGIKGVATGDVWTATGFTEIDTKDNLGSKGDSQQVTVRDMWAQVENDAIAVRFGYSYFSGVQQGGDYNTGIADVSNWIGETLVARIPAVKVDIKEVGLSVFYGIDQQKGDDDSSTDTADTPYELTYMGAIYSKSFGDISVGFEYNSVAGKINKDAGGAVKGAHDGSSSSEIAIGVGYTMDKMKFGFNYGTVSEKEGTTGAKALSTTLMDIMFDMQMEGALKGISAGYHTKSADKMVGADKKQNNSTAMSVGTAMGVGAATVHIEYSTKTTKGTEDGAKAGSSSTLGVRLKYGF